MTVFENAGSVDKSEADAELRGQIVKSVTFDEEELSDGVDYINRIESSSGNGRWYAEPYLNRVKGEAYLTAEVKLWDGSSATLRFNIKYDVMPSDLYIDLRPGRHRHAGEAAGAAGRTQGEPGGAKDPGRLL